MAFAETDRDLPQKVTPDGLKQVDLVIFANTMASCPSPTRIASNRLADRPGLDGSRGCGSANGRAQGNHRVVSQRAVNDAFIALGAAGAVTATAPVDWILGWLDWRRLFLPVAATTTAATLLMLLLVLEPPKRSALASSRPLAIRSGMGRHPRKLPL